MNKKLDINFKRNKMFPRGDYMYNAISFFSNAGIGDLGVEQAGVRVLYANELLPKRANTYSLNHKKTEVKVGDINDIGEKEYKELLKKKEYKNLFLLVATPPCQGVSLAGRRDIFDERNQLIKPTINAIKMLKPQWVWLENVPTYEQATIPDCENIVNDGKELERITILNYIKKHLEPIGYKIEYKILDAKDYGIPQTRKRLIMIMTRTDKTITFPTVTHGNEKGMKKYKTVRDAIGKLEKLEAGEKSLKDQYHYALQHNEKHIKWLKATPEGRSAFSNINFDDKPTVVDKKTGELRLIKAFNNTYKRIWWDQPSPTVTMASGVISSQENVHPRDSRTLTLREVMKLQTIPNGFKFPREMSDKEKRDIVGEAVPVQLAKVITEHIIKMNEEK